MISTRLIFLLAFVTSVICASTVAHAQEDSELRTRMPANVKEGPRFVLSLYHFNIQAFKDDKAAKSRLVTQSLDPLLDIYIKHPDWGCDIEMQALMLDFLDAYHPAVLSKLRKLVARGQVELVSNGWSGTLTLAYPLHDHDWNSQFADDVYSRLKLQRAPVVFAPDGQFGAGLLYYMKKSGFFIALAPATTLQHFHSGDRLQPLYRAWSGFVLPAGAKFKRSDFSVEWNYFNNAENAVAKGASPAETSFKYDPAAAAAHSNKLASLAAAGGIVCRISDYVKYARTTKFNPPELPVLPDSTWSLDKAESFYLWMGWYASPVEKDIDILSSDYATRNELVLAETIINYAKTREVDTSSEEGLLRDAWHALLLAEVSGATGPAPTSDEVEAALALSWRAKDTAVNITRNLKSKLNMPAVEIDSYNGDVRAPTAADEQEQYPAVKCPFTPTIAGAERSYSISCSRASGTETQMLITVTPDRWGLSLLTISFPLLGNRLQFSPALMETYFADFAFEDFTNPDFIMPLPNGLIGLGDSKTFLITHNAVSHLAARVDPSSKTVSLQIKNAQAKPFTIKLSIVSADPATALEIANKINTFPHGLR